MEFLLTKKAISVTELREPKKVIENAGSQPVAILNRSKVVGYFVPASAVEKVKFSEATSAELEKLMDDLDPKALAVNDYLKNK